MAKKIIKKHPSFEDSLILSKYFLNLFGVKSISDFSYGLNTKEVEENIDGINSGYYEYLKRYTISNNLQGISIDKLREYDDNIQAHTKKIQRNRNEKIRWKYFQYLSLLFTEIYLDKYFNNKKELLGDLNFLLEKTNQDLENGNIEKLTLTTFTEKDLNKLAYMCATGSGKTLIMHINILQYIHYFKIAKQNNSSLSMNKTILLTPNEGLSKQHLEEFEKSSVKAYIFSKNEWFHDEEEVMIIDINKLREDSKVKTVAVDSFGSNNLLIVDEGHKGLSSKNSKTDGVWYNNRNKLMNDGFSFEYSATFKQAIDKDNDDIIEEYGKSIIIDYSYKYFHKDGYGKDYEILNLSEEKIEGNKFIYLCGMLFTFYKKIKLYVLEFEKAKDFNIEKPLMIFVGNSVVAIKKETTLTKPEEELLTDVEFIVKFFDDFVSNKNDLTKITLKNILNGESGLVNNAGKDIFLDEVNELKNYLRENLDEEYLYKDIMNMVFMSSNYTSPRVHLIKKSLFEDEIGLKIGESNKCFGVISIGNTNEFINICDKKGIVVDNVDFNNEDLFDSINNKDSSINVLIGSRKFTEGWNSYRVSTMGLINFGKSEGSQAIQLFGRGVRLHGYNNTLLRSHSARLMRERINANNSIKNLETLKVFGVKAKYMEEFQKFLDKESLPKNQKTEIYYIPVKNRYSDLNCKNLKVIKLKNGVYYNTQGEKYVLDVSDELFHEKLEKSKTLLDLRNTIQIIESVKNNMNSIDEEIISSKLDNNILQYIDYNRIYQELSIYKKLHRYINVIIDKKKLNMILKDNFWYEIITTKDLLKINSINKINKITDIAILLFKSYLDKSYTYHREKWENPKKEYVDLNIDDKNFDEEYQILYTPNENNKYEYIDDNKRALNEFIDELNVIKQTNGYINESRWATRYGNFNESIYVIYLNRHLFTPLLHIKDKIVNSEISIQSKPVSLNDGENKFIDKISNYWKNVNTIGNTIDSLAVDTNIYLLRNKPKVGMGFFDVGNFYPDFIMWIDKPEAQYITFIDPKGLTELATDDLKIKFYQKIKEEQETIPIKDKKIILNSFILSVTPFDKLKLCDQWKSKTKKELNDMNIIFIDDDDCIQQIFDRTR